MSRDHRGHAPDLDPQVKGETELLMVDKGVITRDAGEIDPHLVSTRARTVAVDRAVVTVVANKDEEMIVDMREGVDTTKGTIEGAIIKEEIDGQETIREREDDIRNY